MQHCQLTIRSLDEVSLAAAFFSHFYPDPQSARMGISEMLVNAIEHGNLEIGFDEKGVLLTEGRWREEVEQRLTLPNYSDRRVDIHMFYDDDHLKLVVEDQGIGFDWQHYTRMDPSDVTGLHGRGISMAQLISFDEVFYENDGRVAVCLLRKKMG